MYKHKIKKSSHITLIIMKIPALFTLIFLILSILSKKNTLLAKTHYKQTEELYPNKIRTIDKIDINKEKPSNNVKMTNLCTFNTIKGSTFIWNAKEQILETSIIQRNSSLLLAYKIHNNNYIYLDYARTIYNKSYKIHSHIVKIELINNVLYETHNIGLKTQVINTILDFNKMQWYNNDIANNIICIKES